MILACIIGILIVGIKFIKEHVEQYYPVFWLEWLAIFAFGVSWLIKGKWLLADRESDRKFDQRIQQRSVTS